MRSARKLIQQLSNSERTNIISVLLTGRPGSGKSALSAELALDCAAPYTKLITADSLLGYSESNKCQKFAKIFEDAYKSPLSVIVVDDIERQLEFVSIGPRFSNTVLQTMLVLFKKNPPPGRKLLVIATSSAPTDILQEMELIDSFDTVLNIPLLTNGSEVKNVLKRLDLFNVTELEAVAQSFRGRLPIKKLLNVAEMARLSEEKTAVVERFYAAMKEYGIDSFNNN